MSATGRTGSIPLLALSVFGGAASSNVTIELGLTGPSLAYGNSCAAGLIAIGEAARLIEDGRVPVMLAGGAEAPLSPLVVGAFAMIRVLSTRNDDPATASRPFDSGRDGFVIAEGATVLVLESLDHARARGARIYAEIAGYGTTSDAYHMTAPHPDGTHAARAMSAAHASAGLTPTRIDYINAHGSIDRAQRLRPSAARSGSRWATMPSRSPSAERKDCTGTPSARPARWKPRSARWHWSAVPPGTANLIDLDPACDLDIIPPGGRDQQVDTCSATPSASAASTPPWFLAPV